jgi:hypothetical protein
MTRDKALRVLISVAVCAALLGVLVVLTSNLDDVELGPGVGSPESRPAEAAEEAVGSGGPALDFAFVRHLLFVAFTVSLAIVLVGALLTRFLRRWLYLTIGLFGALIVFDFFATKTPSSKDLELDDVAREGIVAAASVRQQAEWSRVLIAVGLSLGAGTAVALSTSWAVARWRAHASRRRGGEIAWELELLAEQTLAARGDTDLVLRCYREMVDLLSRKKRIAHASLTPREFADRLRDLDVRTEAVDRLTELFELVRYGHRDSDPFSKPAMKTLEDIQDEIRRPKD